MTKFIQFRHFLDLSNAFEIISLLALLLRRKVSDGKGDAGMNGGTLDVKIPPGTEMRLRHTLHHEMGLSENAF
ncbi:MAG: hypothetical protein KGI54_14520 [Pseudomonadota bacterium]|nr:hypothetical protein [Pseudomonadota bacterium]